MKQHAQALKSAHGGQVLMLLNTRIEEELVKQVKHAAIDRGWTISQVVEKALRAWFRAEQRATAEET